MSFDAIHTRDGGTMNNVLQCYECACGSNGICIWVLQLVQLAQKKNNGNSIKLVNGHNSTRMKIILFISFGSFNYVLYILQVRNMF